MNLHCNAFEMNQTPTYITWMCLVQPDGSIPSYLSGKKALHSVQVYKEWIKSRVNGTWPNYEDLQSVKEFVEYHLKLVDDSLKNVKRLKVWFT